MKSYAYNFFSNLAYRFKRMSFARNILIIYLLIMLIGAIILWLPFSQTGNLSWDPVVEKAVAVHKVNPNFDLSKYNNGIIYEKGYMTFLDTLFTAASAFSDTGLSPNSISVVYNPFGQAIIAILIMIGGIGWFALKVFIFNIIFFRPIAFRTRESLAAERGSIKIGVSRSLIKTAVITLLSLTFIFSIVLSSYFFFLEPNHQPVMNDYGDYVNKDLRAISMIRSDLIFQDPHHNVFGSITYGVFHTISALNNAGFDIIGNDSLMPYYTNMGLQLIFMLLFVIGGIGYPVIYDVVRYFQTRNKDVHFRWSLFTCISVTAYFIIAVIGLGVSFAIETTNSASFWSGDANIYGNKGNKTMALIFNTMSTRNAGFSTISMHDLARGTLVQYVVMMFIGSAPSSTAGGIRTTTIAIIVLSLWGRLRGRESVYAFKRRIPTQTVNKAFLVFFISTLLVFVGTFISLTSFKSFGGQVWTSDSIQKGLIGFDVHNNVFRMIIHDGGGKTHFGEIVRVYSYTELLFEVSSAFGTTGLSAGITTQLSMASKISLILIMFIGQLGISSTILVWGKQNNIDKHYKWIKHDVTIG